MDKIETEFEGEAVIEYTINCRCPYEDMTDVYDCEIVIHPRNKTVEMKSLRKFLDSYEGREISQEDLTEEIFREIRDEVSSHVRVRITGTHFGIEQRCLRSVK